MHVTRAGLRAFRNYDRADVALALGLNVVVGPNGAGKTNLLEALYFGLTARSFRTSAARDLVRIGERVARVEVHVQAEDGVHALEVGIEPGTEKRIRVDGAPLAPGADPPRPLVSVFLPDRLELVKGAPAVRRAHLDRVVAALWPARVANRTSYTRALAQRNTLIGRIRSGAAAPGLLDPWDSELARHAAALMADRTAAAELVAPEFVHRAAELGLPEVADLRYSPRCAEADPELIRRELLERRDSDLDRGFTTHGPHRDDLTLRQAARPLRTFGSQGQQRIALLALLFAERDVLATRGAAPLMLLDDVMSELDLARRERLAELVAGEGQTVITATEPEHVPGAESAAVLSVTGGTVTPAGADALT